MYTSIIQSIVVSPARLYKLMGTYLGFQSFIVFTRTLGFHTAIPLAGLSSDSTQHPYLLYIPQAPLNMIGHMD